MCKFSFPTQSQTSDSCSVCTFLKLILLSPHNQFSISQISPLLAPASQAFLPRSDLSIQLSLFLPSPCLLQFVLSATGCILLLKFCRSCVISGLVSLPIAPASFYSHKMHSAAASATASEGRSDFSCQFSTFLFSQGLISLCALKSVIIQCV